MRRPTIRQMQIALDVLLAVYEQPETTEEERRAISGARSALHDRVDAAAAGQAITIHTREG